MKLRSTVLLLPLLLVLPVALGLQVNVSSLTIHALAVTDHSGEVINITLIMLRPGDGHVYIAATPLPLGSEGTLFISSSQLAMYIASIIAGVNPDNYTFLVKPQSTLIIIGGPSASAYMTCAMYALLTNSSFRHDVTMTGMILPGGIVGPVSGVPYKLRAAAEKGFRIVLVPALNYLMLSPRDIPPELKVVPVINVHQAISYFTGRKLILNNITVHDIAQSALIKLILRKLWNLMYSRYLRTVDLSSIPEPARREISQLYLKAVNESKLGNYYTAASLLYAALIKYYEALLQTRVSRYGVSILVNTADEVKSRLSTVETELSHYEPTTLTIDLIVGIYDRVRDAQTLLRTYRQRLAVGDIEGAIEVLAEAKARVETLYDWLEILKYMHSLGGQRVSIDVVKSTARMYIQFLKALVGYAELVSRILTTPEEFAARVQELEQLYLKGEYIKALSLSFSYSSELSEDLMLYYTSRAAEISSTARSRVELLVELADVLRRTVLTELWRLAKANLTSFFAFTYLEYGDHYLDQASRAFEQGNIREFVSNLVLAYRFYTSALLHVMLVRAVLISTGMPVPSEIKVHETAHRIPAENKTRPVPIVEKRHENMTTPVQILLTRVHLEQLYLYIYLALLVAAVLAFVLISVLELKRRGYVT